MQQSKIKLLELGKIRTKNASPDMFNVYVVLVGRDTAELPSAGANSKPHHYKKSSKIERLSENMGLTGKPFDASDQKKRTEKNSRPCTKTQLNARILKTTN